MCVKTNDHSFLRICLLQCFLYNNLYRRAALEKWKQKLGSEATYRKLAESFERAGHYDLAKVVNEVCSYCK